MKLLSFAVIAALGSLLIACGPFETTCEECLAEQGQAMTGDGCYPYCEALPDADSDGIDDASDACPTNPETVNSYLDADGCPDERPIPIELSTEIVGTWAGTTTLTVNGGAYQKAHSIPITVNVDRLSGSISGFCPDGSGAVPLGALTTAPDAAWSGIYACPPGPWGTCVDGTPIRANMIVLGISVVPTPSGVSVRLHGAVTLTDNDDTRPSPCDQTGEFDAEFSGAR